MNPLNRYYFQDLAVILSKLQILFIEKSQVEFSSNSEGVKKVVFKCCNFMLRLSLNDAI